MSQKQTPRAKTIPPMTPEAIELHKDDLVVEEKQSYAMVTGLLQVLVYMQSLGIKRQPANLFIRYQGGQYCLQTVSHVCCKLSQPVS